jgi:predicted lactoylglutathione lyase
MMHSDKKSDRELPNSASAAHIETIDELFARMDAMGGDPLFPNGRGQNLAPVREYPWDERPAEEDPTP